MRWIALTLNAVVIGQLAIVPFAILAEWLASRRRGNDESDPDVRAARREEAWYPSDPEERQARAVRIARSLVSFRGGERRADARADRAVIQSDLRSSARQRSGSVSDRRRIASLLQW